MARIDVYASIAVSLAIVAACSGSLQGVVREDAKRVPFNYAHAQTGAAEVQVTMPDGEQFKGRVDRGTRNTEPDAGRTQGRQGFTAVEYFDGNAEAVLSGSRGKVMKCRFRMTDVIIGFSSGGFGLCQVSDGKVIDIFF